MTQLIKNNANAGLATSVLATDTSIAIDVSKADRFPVANTGAAAIGAGADWFKMTLQKVTGEVEIVYVRTRTLGSGTLANVIRAQEGTTALAFTAGQAVASLRITSSDIQSAITAPAAITAALAAHIANPTGAHAASAVSVADTPDFLPSTIADVEAAIAWLARRVKVVDTSAAAFAATLVIDAKTGYTFHNPTMTANITVLTLTDPDKVGGLDVEIYFTQDATGNRTLTLPAGWKGSGSLGLLPNQVSVLYAKYNPVKARVDYVINTFNP